MALILRITQDSVFKQQPLDSSQIPDANDKVSVKKGTELELHSWAQLDEDNGHIRVALAKDSFNGKNTWYVYTGHVEILVDGKVIVIEPPVSMKVKEVRSCSTVVVRGLDKQIIAEINALVPNALVSFDDLNVRLGNAVWPLLQLPAKWALARAIRDRGVPMVVNSGYRTIAQQLILFNHYRAGRCGILAAARPPRSNHQSGLAIDISEYWAWKPFLERHGWRWLGPWDPVHFDYVRGGTRDIRDTAVLAFQRLWNRYSIDDTILEDGAYGPSTEYRLNNSYVEGFDVTVGGYRVLRLSLPYMRGEDVFRVQQALAEAGYKVDVDGIYGPGTQTAVKQFQKDKGLEADGIVGPQTRIQLGVV